MPFRRGSAVLNQAGRCGAILHNDVPGEMGNRLPSALREDGLELRMLRGTELERWRRAYPEAWKEFEASEPQRAKGRAAGSDDAGDSNDV